MLNLFIGWDREDLETELRAAQEDLAAGKATVRMASADVGVWSETENSLTSRIEMLLQALSRIAPQDYPPAQVTRSSSFRMVFNSQIRAACDPNGQD